MRLFGEYGGYGAGEQLRDFVHVDDVVAVNLWFLEHPERSGVFNLGTGRAQSFNEVAHATVNACRALRGEGALSLEQLVAKKLIQYVEFPAGAGRQVPVPHAGRPRRRCAPPAASCNSRTWPPASSATSNGWQRRPLERVRVRCGRNSCRPRRWPERLSQRPLVFTNGVFDVLHTGHVTCTWRPRASSGAALLVAVNTDASARRLGKGPDRPLNRESDRALVVAALASVSCVTLFDEDTPCELMQRCRPEVYVKGGDYDIEALRRDGVGAQLGRQGGGDSVRRRLLHHGAAAAHARAPVTCPELRGRR